MNWLPSFACVYKLFARVGQRFYGAANFIKAVNVIRFRWAGFFFKVSFIACLGNNLKKKNSATCRRLRAQCIFWPSDEKWLQSQGKESERLRIIRMTTLEREIVVGCWKWSGRNWTAKFLTSATTSRCWTSVGIKSRSCCNSWHVFFSHLRLACIFTLSSYTTP